MHKNQRTLRSVPGVSRSVKCVKRQGCVGGGSRDTQRVTRGAPRGTTAGGTECVRVRPSEARTARELAKVPTGAPRSVSGVAAGSVEVCTARGAVEAEVCAGGGGHRGSADADESQVVRTVGEGESRGVGRGTGSPRRRGESRGGSRGCGGPGVKGWSHRGSSGAGSGTALRRGLREAGASVSVACPGGCGRKKEGP